MSEPGKEPAIFDLPRFQAELDQMTYRQAGLQPDTHQRYKKGRLPSVLMNLLVKHPHLAQALCTDLANYPRLNP